MKFPSKDTFIHFRLIVKGLSESVGENYNRVSFDMIEDSGIVKLTYTAFIKNYGVHTGDTTREVINKLKEAIKSKSI